LEFRENKNFLRENPILPLAEILLLAGDIVPFAVMNKHSDFFDFVSDHFKYTYWIPGNHEYYGSDLAQKSGSLNESIRANVSLVNNASIVLDTVRFIFSTLWSKISPDTMWTIQQSISDFRTIHYNGEPFTAHRFNQLHEDCLAFLNEELEDEKAGKTVVVTHHVPSFMQYPAKYKGDVLNAAFAVELHDLIADSGIDYWIYGHHHTNCPEYLIGKTKMLTNQLGYIKYSENQGFSPGRCFEI
jgi:predicted phosphohydrolase